VLEGIERNAGVSGTVGGRKLVCGLPEGRFRLRSGATDMWQVVPEALDLDLGPLPLPSSGIKNSVHGPVSGFRKQNSRRAALFRTSSGLHPFPSYSTRENAFVI
jgi:hypothetical protein